MQMSPAVFVNPHFLGQKTTTICPQYLNRVEHAGVLHALLAVPELAAATDVHRL